MFDWDDFLVVAGRLAQEAGDEAAQRTAISRAYYAAYHAAAAFVRAQGILRTRHTHQWVWGVLMADADRDRADVGRRGDRLRRRRIEADYANPFPGDVAGRAHEAVAQAKAVIDTLDRLS